jgi:hypothetical protein
MDPFRAVKLYHKYASALAYIDVENTDGTRSIGSSFHIGEGVFITARHVVEGKRIVEIKIPEPVPVSAEEIYPDVDINILKRGELEIKKVLGYLPLYKFWTDPLMLSEGPYYPRDNSIDLAIFKVSNIHKNTAIIRLGYHLDDWIYRKPWIMSEAIIMGFPPIPMTTQPYLIAAKAQIHAYVNLRGCPNIHFILSATPRGGFSGGLALHEGDFALGVITTGLHEGNQQIETGILAVLSVEPIHVLLDEIGMLPKVQLGFRESSFVSRKRKNK